MAFASFTRFMRSRLFPPSDPVASLEGKTVLVTGGSSGLGLEAAIKFINLGVSLLIIGCRSIERGNEAKKLIEQRTNRTRTGLIQIWPLEMNDYRSVMAFAERVNNEVPRLDIALLNAGVHSRYYTLSAEGWEQDIQVNALSTALLGLLLLPKLRASRDPQTDGAAHLSFVSSGSYRLVTADRLWPPREEDGSSSEGSSILDHLNKRENFVKRGQYALSKLLLEYVVKNVARLTRRDDGTVEVIVNSICPGACRSGLTRDYTAFHERLALMIAQILFTRTAEQGSRSLVSGTLLGEESHGKLWKNDEFPE